MCIHSLSVLQLYCSFAVTDIVSSVTGLQIPCLPKILLLNDDSEDHRRVDGSQKKKKKKILIMMWIPPRTLSVKLWLSSHHSVLILEMSVASVNIAKV